MAHRHDIETYSTPPTLADLEAAAREAFAGIPAELRRHAKNVVVRVEDFPDDETLEDMDCESAFDLLGLYRGVDLTRRRTSTWSSSTAGRSSTTGARPART
jgi:predicted Zn-dependent protease with MMP-like domain